jgi:type I restriction enzyme R subunit
MSFSEADTRAKLIDPGIHARGWTEDLIRREETADAIEIIEGRPQKSAGIPDPGRIDRSYRIEKSRSHPSVIRIKTNPITSPNPGFSIFCSLI